MDVLLFNPPYVPTESDEWESAQERKSLDGAWAGGIDGMQLTNELLDCVDVGDTNIPCSHTPILLRRCQHLLAPQGRFYLVALKANGIENIQAQMLEKFRLASEVCKSITYSQRADLTARVSC